MVSFDVCGDDGPRAHQARLPIRTPQRIVAPEPIDALSSTTVRSSSQSSSSLQAAGVGRRHAAGVSLMNITPWPDEDLVADLDAVQMNVWLWILQRAPIAAPRWISTNGPIRVSSPIRQP